MTQPYETVCYHALALDPIHVGTGGYRLGRVDLSIVREPGTNIPKIPGTSLSGVTRACAAMATGRYDWEIDRTKPDGTTIRLKGSCAGQGQDDEKRAEAGHCGSPYCPICVAFGFARGDSGGFQGLAQFSDARILFFPVHSLLGPVWITSPGVLKEHKVERDVADDKVKLGSGLSSTATRLNLGWLMLEREETEAVSFSDTELPYVPTEIKQCAVLVSDKLFGQIINDNLEVRTSVSIDPATGAADDGALFTYEAIPRSTVLWFRLTYSKPRFFRIKDKNGQMTLPAPKEEAIETGADIEIKEVVQRGLAALEHAGIGGMNTRGLGRLRVFIPADDSANDHQTHTNATATGGGNES